MNIDLNNKFLTESLLEKVTTKRTGFEEMVYSVLGESSLSRVLRQRSSHDTGCITAFRYNIPEARAKKLNAKLNQILQNKGYGTTFVDGYYQELEMEKASKEQSIFVVDLHDDGKLKQTLIALGTQFGQESILFKPKDGEARLIRTSMKSNGKESNPSTKTEWGKHSSAAWTQVNGRDFGDNIETSADYWEDEEVAEEPLPKITVQGSEILYNKRGRACGIKIQVNDQGTVYMKRRGSNWEITDISQQNDDQRVWDMVKSSLEKMAKKNPTTFIRFMRNRAYELPKFKPTTLGESVTVRGLEVTPQDIQRRTSGLTVAQIQQWLNAHDNTEFASMPDIVSSIENGETKEQRMGRAFGKVKTIVYSQLNLTEDNPQVDDIIMKHLQTAKSIPTTDTSAIEFVNTFWDDELKQFKQSK